MITILHKRALVMSWLLLTALVPNRAIGQDVLRIVSPSEGAKYLPGTTVVVDVACLDPSVIKEVIVSLGKAQEGPLPCATAMRFYILIPANVNIGSYSLTAVGSKGPGLGVALVAKPVAVGITSSALPSRLIAEQAELWFPYVGSKSQIMLSGEFSGEVRSVVEDPSIQVQIADTAVATVDGNLFVTSRRQGSTTVLVQYVDAVNGRSVDLRIPITVLAQHSRGDFDGDGDVDSDDVNALLLYANGSPASVPGDARDLNGDGKIDALDARVLTTLCTRARCATH